MQNPADTDTAKYQIDTDLVSSIHSAVENSDAERLSQLLSGLHEADIADLLEQVSPEFRTHLVDLWGQEFTGDVLAEIGEPIRGEILATLDHNQLASAVRELESDDVVDLIADLREDQQEAVLDVLDSTDRAAVEDSLQYPDESAGRLMQREVVMIPEHWNVGEAIDYLRAADELPEQFYHLILVKPNAKPIAQIALGRLMASPRDASLLELTEKDFRTFPAVMSQREVAYAFNQYHLISVPVVDRSGRLIGTITIDDAMGVLEAEAEEDILRLAGVGDESLTDRIAGTTRQRFPWLIINLLSAIIASMVIDAFADAIHTLVALAVLMPIVASMGGNAATQSLTVAVRALATKDLTISNKWRIIRRETAVGLLNGLIFAVITGAIGGFWYQNAGLGAIIALAMVITMLAAGLAGILIPIGLERVRIDPALASGVFVTTITDVVGFFAFLGLATLLLV